MPVSANYIPSHLVENRVWKNATLTDFEEGIPDGGLTCCDFLIYSRHNRLFTRWRGVDSVKSRLNFSIFIAESRDLRGFEPRVGYFRKKIAVACRIFGFSLT